MTGRLLLALLIMGAPLAGICVGMALLDRLAVRRERRLRPGFIAPPPAVSLDAARLQRRVDAARRQADNHLRYYGKARP